MWFISAIVLLAAGSAYGENGPEPGCAVDICFLVDASGSIRETNWDGFVIPFLENIVNALHDAGVDANVGIQLFATEAAASPDLLLTNVLENNNLDDTILPTIEGLVYTGGFTNIAQGIIACQDNVLGGPNNRAEAQDVIVLISDGLPNRDEPNTLPAANYAKSQLTTIIAVAVGSFDLTILKDIASEDDYVIQVDDFEALVNLLDDLFNLIEANCGPPIETTTTTPPPPPTGFCFNCGGDMIPAPTVSWSTVNIIELEWNPLSQFTPPDPDVPDPDELFELEAYVLYYASYVWYVGFVPPVYPVATTTRTPLLPP